MKPPNSGALTANLSRRGERHGFRSGPMRSWSLNRSGFIIRRLTDYQFRIDDRLDLFPIHRRWHDTKTNKRGGYRQAKEIAMRILRGGKW